MSAREAAAFVRWARGRRRIYSPALIHRQIRRRWPTVTLVEAFKAVSLRALRGVS